MNNFTLYMIAAGKASLSLFCSIAGGLTNIVLDYLFIAVSVGVGGAALAPRWGTPSQPSWAAGVLQSGTVCSILLRPVCRPQTLRESRHKRLL